MTLTLIVTYIPLGLWIEWAKQQYPFGIIMFLIGVIFVVFESIKLCSPLIGSIQGALVPLLILGPSLFIQPAYAEEYASLIALVPIGCVFGFLVSSHCLFKRKGFDGLPSKIKFWIKINPPWIPFAILLILWLIQSHFMYPYSETTASVRFVLSLFIASSFLFIVYRNINDNIKNRPKIFYDLAKLPLLIIISHIILLISGKTYNSEGGWWILYSLIIFCPLLSIPSIIIGLIIKRTQRNRVD
ncbi:MAG: hypothetical protein KKC46_17465 [Proteobacteria bacterium]|nr:hypothetical protein [Pseudomonadota bacterium]